MCNQQDKWPDVIVPFDVGARQMGAQKRSNLVHLAWACCENWFDIKKEVNLRRRRIYLRHRCAGSITVNVY
jgi:hypothetical protein